MLTDNQNTGEVKLFGYIEVQVTNADALQGNFISVCAKGAAKTIVCINPYRSDHIDFVYDNIHRGIYMIFHCEYGDGRTHAGCSRYKFIYFVSINEFVIFGYDLNDILRIHMRRELSRFY